MSEKKTPSMPHILLVEDDSNDVELMEIMFQQFGITVELDVVVDGKAALEFLYKEGIYKEAIHPDLIFLDLNLPKLSGLQVLKAVKDDTHLKHIPIIVLTSSDLEQDINNAYALQANCFLNKPFGLEEFSHMLKLFSDVWFNYAQLPPHP